MFHQDFAGWSSIGKTFFEPIFDVQRIQMPYFEKLTRQTIACMSDNTAANIKYMQSLNKVNKLEDFIKAQLICLTEQVEKNLQHGQQFMKIAEEGVREFRHIASEKMSHIFTETEEAVNKHRKNMQ